VLGEHFVRHEGAVAAHLAMGDHPRPLAEQIGQHPGVAHRHVVLEIGHDEAHFEAAGRALHTALGHHTPEPEVLAVFHLPRGDRRRVEEERHVRAEGAQSQRAGDSNARHDP
jgi:hypothetical protein